MNRRHLVAAALADALLAGPSDIDALAARMASCLGRKHRWIAPLCRRLFGQFGSSLIDAKHRQLVQWLLDDSGYGNAWSAARPPKIVHYFLDPPRMSPRKGALAACSLPSLRTAADLAQWLAITIGELDWFADVRNLNPSDGALSHYRYAWVPKRFGARLMEIPKHRLREIQRKILRGILDPVPVHGAAHGFMRGRSCRSYAEPHVGRDVVLRMDLRAFFPSIPASRVHALFEMLGYPEAVSRILTALCTNQVPISLARGGSSSWEDAKRLGVPHLPQGAPTSPALANLCALHLDFRLDALAQAIEGRYTRYADDLAFSGGPELRRSLPRVSQLITNIAMEEGFEINRRKTRTMRRGQRQILTGIVVNEKLNVPRRDFDRLKATLTNCARQGPGSQNRENAKDFRAHLAGRIAQIASVSPTRGAALERLFRQIEWTYPHP